jgi:hypothetical protein
MSATHEDFRREVHRSGPSDRGFGLVIWAALTVIGLLPLRRHHPIRWWAIAVAAIFLLLALARPRLLHRANLIWMRIGLLIGKVVNPVVTALLFFLVFSPAAIVLRWLGKDPLALRLEPKAQTYWVDRTPSTARIGMADQF